MLLYDELAGWYPLFAPPGNYAIEAELYTWLLQTYARSPRTLLDLGSGGGNVSYELKRTLTCTLVDRSPAMLAASRAVNPESEHVLGDMRTLRLGRRFDIVLVHDAVMYMTTEEDLAATMATAFAHVAGGGCALFVPDFTRETFRPGDSYGGRDSTDGARGLRYLQWVRDPDPDDSTVTIDFALMLRQGDTVEVRHDRHLHGLFSRATWTRLLAEAGFVVVDRPEHGGVLVGQRP